MSAWIESHQTLRGHPKTRKLAVLLDVPLAQAIGHLHCLWWWALDYAEDGNLNRYDETDIALGCEWSGDADRFVTVLQEAGWIDMDAHDNRIHDWHEYAGRLLDRRERDRQRKSKGRVTLSSGHPTDVRRTSDGTPADGARTEQNLTKRRDLSDANASDDGFDAFWSAYPRKEAKKPARQKWGHLSKQDRIDALAAAVSMADCVTRGYREKTYCPQPTTFLNQRRWEDWKDGAPTGYVPEISGPAKPPICPDCRQSRGSDTPLTHDEEGAHCPICGWRKS